MLNILNVNFIIIIFICSLIDCKDFFIKTNSFDSCLIKNCSNSFKESLTNEIYKKYTTQIPTQFTCDGLDISPELNWNRINGTKSFVLIMDDPDAIPVVGKTFIHWFVYDIPAFINKFPKNVQLGTGIFINVKQLKNDFGNANYGGPCPPKNDQPHIYRFSLFALNVTNISLSAALNADEFAIKFNDNIIDCTRLTGVYSRK